MPLPPSPPPASRMLIASALLCAGLVVTPASANPVQPASFDQDSHSLSARDIYSRLLENRFETFVQRATLVSRDRSGNEQQTRLEMWFKSFRDAAGSPLDGETLSKVLVRYTHPFDLRHSGYLLIQKLHRLSDQFIYRASSQRIQRVNLRSEPVFGTDFSFEDVIPREVEDLTYERVGDSDWAGRPCYVIHARPVDPGTSEYSRIETFIDREYFVPLRTRYWDKRGLEVKEMHSPPDSVEVFGSVSVPMLSTMRNLKLESTTTLHIDELVPNGELARAQFDIRRLERH